MKLRNKIFTIIIVAFVIVAIAGIIIGYALIGADIGAWFTSRWAYWFYIGIAIFIFVWIGLEIQEKIKKL